MERGFAGGTRRPHEWQPHLGVPAPTLQPPLPLYSLGVQDARLPRVYPGEGSARTGHRPLRLGPGSPPPGPPLSVTPDVPEDSHPHVELDDQELLRLLRRQLRPRPLVPALPHPLQVAPEVVPAVRDPGVHLKCLPKVGGTPDGVVCAPHDSRRVLTLPPGLTGTRGGCQDSEPRDRPRSLTRLRPPAGSRTFGPVSGGSQGRTRDSGATGMGASETSRGYGPRRSRNGRVETPFRTGTGTDLPVAPPLEPRPTTRVLQGPGPPVSPNESPSSLGGSGPSVR